MDNFTRALYKLRFLEGGYTNDPRDPGGETYRGVSRVHNPDRRGWDLIDIKKVAGVDFLKALEEDQELQRLIKQLYKEKYWNSFRGDQIDSASVSDRMFNIVTHINLKFAVTSLQLVLNALNSIIVEGQPIMFDDLKIDGLIGPRTIGALDKYCSDARIRDGHVSVVQGLQTLQANYYLTNTSGSDADSLNKRVFIRGFLNRAFSDS